MSLDALLAEYDQEMAGTRRALASIPRNALAYRPHERSWTMGELATHIASVPTWLRPTLETPELDLGESLESPAVPSDTEELLARFDAAVAEGRKALEGATPEAMAAPWTLRNGAQVFFSLPRGAVVRTMVMSHMIHHRGQLTVYLRLAGAPVPGLYGPSGDDAAGGA